MNYLIVVDMQNDFISGSLGSPAAQGIVDNVAKKVIDYNGEVIFTRDTHGADYLSTQEGTKLPDVHCVKGTDGWQICETLLPYVNKVIDKPTFGSIELIHYLSAKGDVTEVELCGLCTDICVISNAMLVKAAFPEAKISVIASCCAGVTEESHQNALAAMKAVQIEVK